MDKHHIISNCNWHILILKMHLKNAANAHPFDFRSSEGETSASQVDLISSTTLLVSMDKTFVLNWYENHNWIETLCYFLWVNLNSLINECDFKSRSNSAVIQNSRSLRIEFHYLMWLLWFEHHANVISKLFGFYYHAHVLKSTANAFKRENNSYNLDIS